MKREIKVVGINGSPRKGGNTEHLLKEVLRQIEENGITTELFQLGGKQVKQCIACMKCREIKDGYCHNDNDFANSCIDLMRGADGIIIGSPVYFADITPEVKALIDVSGFASRGAATNHFRRKAGAAVVAVRRGGAIHSFDSINHFFLINEMMVAGSNYWNIGVGSKRGDVLNDSEGMQTMKVLGDNMAWLLRNTAAER